MDGGTDPKKKKQDAFLALAKRIQVLRQELRQKEDQVEQLQEHVLWLETEFKKKQSDSRDEMVLNLKKENNELKRQLPDSPYKVDTETQTIQHLQPQKDTKVDTQTQTTHDEILKLKKENNELRLQSDSKDHEMLRVEEENKEERQLAESHEIHTDQQRQHQESQKDTQTGLLVELVEEKLKSGLKAIQENVIDLIDDKLARPNDQTQSLIDNMTTHKQTYSNVVKSMKPGMTNDLRAILIEATNDEIAEELDRQSRVNNIIIHGKKEDDGTDDKAFAENLLKDLQVRTTAIKEIERMVSKNDLTQCIGKRPIKLVLKNKDSKDEIINNLRYLKDSVLYKGISIQQDYTRNERTQIKELSDKAREMNIEEVEANVIWRVRGTPSTGLFLKKLKTNGTLIM